VFAEAAPDRGYAQFYRAAVPRLVRFLIAQGLSSNDAVDCVQDTLIDALPPTWDTLDNPYAWCRLVAYRKMCRLVRDRRETPSSEPERLGDVLVGALPDAAEIEHEIDLLSWLAKLTSTNQRTVLAWTYDGATPAEIASVLGMHPDTVRSTLRHARQAMRRVREQERGSHDR
jgi:RNA polymerase sigma-70 factor (ECF subfamily)